MSDDEERKNNSGVVFLLGCLLGGLLIFGGMGSYLWVRAERQARFAEQEYQRAKQEERKALDKANQNHPTPEKRNPPMMPHIDK